MQTIPCIRLSHLSENEKRAYILADNRLQEQGGGWDDDVLKLELDDINFEEFEDFKLEDLDFNFMEDVPPHIDGLFEDKGEDSGQEGKTKQRTVTCPSCGEVINVE